MATQQTAQRLDPERLDEIIEQLELKDAGAIDRITLWYQELLRSIWKWLRSLTGGEDGWLSRLGRWLENFLENSTPSGPMDAGPVLTAITYLSAAALLFAVGLVIYRLWNLYKPRVIEQDPIGYAKLLSDAAAPLGELPLNQRPAAIFSQACLALVHQRRLIVRPDSTNRTLANQAELPNQSRALLQELADSADRALFSAWQPATDELDRLERLRDQITAELATQ